MKFCMFFMVLAIALSGCRSYEEPSFKPLAVDDISAETLWKRIAEETDFKRYSYWPGHEKIQPGQAPHGPFHRVFINRALLDGLPSPDRHAAEGSIIVKENLNSDQKVTGLTVMAKVTGFDSEAGDWFWASYSPEGEARRAGKLEGCIQCHAGMEDNDFVIIRLLDAAIGN